MTMHLDQCTDFFSVTVHCEIVKSFFQRKKFADLHIVIVIDVSWFFIFSFFLLLHLSALF